MIEEQGTGTQVMGLVAATLREAAQLGQEQHGLPHPTCPLEHLLSVTLCPTTRLAALFEETTLVEPEMGHFPGVLPK